MAGTAHLDPGAARAPPHHDEDEYERPAQPDPLSDAEKQLVAQTWAKPNQTPEETGVAMLVRLFVNFPTSKRFFSHIQQLEPGEGLEQSSQMKRHAKRVVKAIDTLVQSLDEDAKLVSVLQEVARSHALRHKVEPIYFKYLNSVIMEVLGEGYPDAFTPAVVTAWNKFLAIIYWVVTGEYEDLEGGV